jgi:hypothetical protein
MKHSRQLHNVTLRDNEVTTQGLGDNSTMVNLQGISNLLACFLNVHLRMFIYYNNSVINSSFLRQKD